MLGFLSLLVFENRSKSKAHVSDVYYCPTR